MIGQTGGNFWAALGEKVRNASSASVPVCVVAEHFAGCSVVTVAEREAHLKCLLCDVAVVYSDC